LIFDRLLKRSATEFPMTKQLKDKKDYRKARLTDAGLLEVFMRRRKFCLNTGYSLVEASEEAHQAVDEVQRRNAPPPAEPDPVEMAKLARNARKWESEV
jgi:hypothetical protein